MKLSRRLVLTGGVTALWASRAWAGYRERAQALGTTLPEGARFRPDLETELLRLANSYRQSNGLPTLQAGDVFALAARAQAADMMENNFIGHSASDGTPFERRLRILGGNIERFGAVGENAARDSKKTEVNASKAAALFQQWVDSRPHRANLKNRDFAYAATGVVQKGNVIWAIQIFWGEERKGVFFGTNLAPTAPGTSPSQ